MKTAFPHLSAVQLLPFLLLPPPSKVEGGGPHLEQQAGVTGSQGSWLKGPKGRPPPPSFGIKLFQSHLGDPPDADVEGCGSLYRQSELGPNPGGGQLGSPRAENAVGVPWFSVVGCQHPQAWLLRQNQSCTRARGRSGTRPFLPPRAPSSHSSQPAEPWVAGRVSCGGRFTTSGDCLAEKALSERSLSPSPQCPFCPRLEVVESKGAWGQRDKGDLPVLGPACFLPGGDWISHSARRCPSFSS